MKSVAILIGFFLLMTAIHGINSESILIPSWIKNSARLWSEQKIDDNVFGQSIQFLIKKEIIQIPISESSEPVYFLPKHGNITFVTISGTTGDFKKINSVDLKIIKPDGQTIESRAAVLESGAYKTTLILDDGFPRGTYKVTGTYNGVAIPMSYFYIKDAASTKIPFWIKNNARWWADGKISDSDFVSSLQYLISKKIVQIEYHLDSSSTQQLHIDMDWKSQVRRGTIQSVNVTVSDGKEPISDATVIVRVEDYGENVLKDFEGNTDSYGKSAFSWEIDKNAKQETLLIFVDVTNGLSSESAMFPFEVICQCGEPDCKCRSFSTSIQ
ncbi:MAG TPA: hypothetical protein VLD38_07395 [Nitrosopumilaceae archaeon]|nr:hypothetical protein [Nitrosopumilaceae archaeon]